ncbi:MAG: MATE family efflux transporter [Acidovorax sp.]|jgi:MATE family multidrug resistance protein|nr:MATE family efflux transporter [Acidovorax sp.]
MSELRTLARHAGTVLVGQLAVMAFAVTDTVVAGRYDASALAALSVGSAVFVSVYISLMGVLQALLPIWAEQHGQGQPVRIGQSFRQSLYLCLLATTLGMAVLMLPGPLLQAAKVPAAMQPEVRAYLHIVALALPAALLLRLFTTLNQSLGHPQLVTMLQLLSLVPKVLLSIWFTFGGAGIPALGAAGCAWATLLVQYGMLFLALWLLRTASLYHPLQLWRRLEAPDWQQLRQFARIGIPAGLSISVEVTSFTLMALFIARQGSQSSASHQIAANLAALCYMVPLSLAIATSARVSYWLGAQRPLLAAQMARLGLQLAAALGLCLALFVWLAGDAILGFYTRDAAVTALAAGLLIWVALYHLADSVQCYCIFVLRSFRITLAPLLTYGLLLWGVGLGGGYLLAYQLQWPPAWHGQPTAFWATSAAALALTAMIFAVMLHRQLRCISGTPGA